MIQDTLEYLMDPSAWLGPGPLVVSGIYALIAVGLWTWFWQGIVRDTASGRFFARRNSWWIGLLFIVLGVLFLIVFAGPPLWAAMVALWNWRVAVGLVVVVVLVLLGVGSFLWANRHNSTT